VSYGPLGPAGEEWGPTDASQLMFAAIVHRGPHAFGWMSFNDATGITVEKAPGKVTEHLQDVQVDDECQWFVGHVRWATNGDPEDNVNNHPLMHGGVVGVHNGVLNDWQPILDETGREDDTALVDSEAIFAAVNKWGIKDGLAKIKGNMVSVFTETKHPQLLHIARSYGRPLIYAFTPNGSMVFASERKVLDALGWKLSGFQTMEGSKYRHLTVRGGKITAREQYKADTTHRTTIPARTPAAAERGGIPFSGITDYFDRGRTKPRRRVSPRGGKDGRGTVRGLVEPPASGGTSLDPLKGTAPGLVDKWGGTYLGAGWYRAASGRVMTIEEYITWQVDQEMARREHMAEIDAEADYRSTLEAQEQEQIEQYLAVMERDGGLQ